jgi:hypothetical protein
MSSPRRSPVTQIPRDICKQEGEIEAMVRNLVRSSDSAWLQRSHDRPDGTRKQKVAAWILVAVYGFISIIGFYLLWLKGSTDCGPYRVLCGGVANALKDMWAAAHP